MSFTEECELCGSKITSSFYWVKCTYWNSHPISECGGCVYPVGPSCVTKIPKEFVERKTNVDDEQEKRMR